MPLALWDFTMFVCCSFLNITTYISLQIIRFKSFYRLQVNNYVDLDLAIILISDYEKYL